MSITEVYTCTELHIQENSYCEMYWIPRHKIFIDMS